ncbi:hypothetical protein Sjap_014284 [Stephania japonica]|uniref:BTB domain-containing protein n=1 Tax=Stephania japonica TaxID=461633 RepID=A0AAP0J1K3_9MAGN
MLLLMTLSLPELNHEKLDTLLEFLYTGTLPTEKVVTHVYSLYTAADKYEIPFLQNFREGWMLESLNTSNVLDVLEASDGKRLKAQKRDESEEGGERATKGLGQRDEHENEWEK